MNANDVETTLRARASFDASLEHIDPATRQRLRAIRMDALALRQGQRFARWMWPAGLAAAGMLALAVFMPRLPQVPLAHGVAPTVVATASPAAAQASAAPRANAAPAAADSLSLEAADPDMLTDLDFYAWLARQPGHRNGNGG